MANDNTSAAQPIATLPSPQRINVPTCDDNLPTYEVSDSSKPAYTPSTNSTNSTSNTTPSILEKLKSRLASTKESRDRRSSLYDLWESKLPRYYAQQNYPTVESYPPHRAEYARELARHQSWYPHYDASRSSKSAASITGEAAAAQAADEEKVQDLKAWKKHQSWYPHYKVEC